MIKIEQGDHCEKYPWEYHRPYLTCTYGYNVDSANSAPCPHVTWTGEVEAKKRPDGSIYAYERPYSVPEAALLLNEAGHNCTVLCLLCADVVRRSPQANAGES